MVVPIPETVRFKSFREMRGREAFVFEQPTVRKSKNSNVNSDIGGCFRTLKSKLKMQKNRPEAVEH
jgi:hypothetical protein